MRRLVKQYSNIAFRIWIVLGIVIITGGIIALLLPASYTNFRYPLLNLVAGLVVLCVPVQIFLFFEQFYDIYDIFKLKGRKSRKSRDLLLYLAAFLIPSKDRDFEIGNMIEIYEKDKKRFGQKRALRLLAVDVIKSAYPLVKRGIGLIVRTVLRTLGLYKIYKSFWG